MNDAERLRYIAGNIEQDQREHSARYLREIADRLPTAADIQFLAQTVSMLRILRCASAAERLADLQCKMKGTP